MGIRGGICPACVYNEPGLCDLMADATRSCVCFKPRGKDVVEVKPARVPGLAAVPNTLCGIQRPPWGNAVPKAPPVVYPSAVGEEDWYNEDGWERRMYGEC